MAGGGRSHRLRQRRTHSATCWHSRHTAAAAGGTRQHSQPVSLWTVEGRANSRGIHAGFPRGRGADGYIRADAEWARERMAGWSDGWTTVVESARAADLTVGCGNILLPRGALTTGRRQPRAFYREADQASRPGGCGQHGSHRHPQRGVGPAGAGSARQEGEDRQRGPAHHHNLRGSQQDHLDALAAAGPDAEVAIGAPATPAGSWAKDGTRANPFKGRLGVKDDWAVKGRFGRYRRLGRYPGGGLSIVDGVVAEVRNGGCVPTGHVPVASPVAKIWQTWFGGTYHGLIALVKSNAGFEGDPGVVPVVDLRL